VTVRAAVILPAAGSGRRMGNRPKAFIEIGGRPMLDRSLEPFLEDDRITAAIVVLDPDAALHPPSWLTRLTPRVLIAEGGSERGDSVRSGLARVPAGTDVILVHDAARPLVSTSIVARAIEAAADGRSVTAAIPLADTLHRTDDANRIVNTPDRTGFWRAQTPQAFPADVLRTAHRKAVETSFTATDDAALVAHFGTTVYVIEGDPANRKITVPEDLAIAEALLAWAGR
jgi:2-C-methyl-D-erythritol 4-phosphate cytidylyltransferase